MMDEVLWLIYLYLFYRNPSGGDQEQAWRKQQKDKRASNIFGCFFSLHEATLRSFHRTTWNLLGAGKRAQVIISSGGVRKKERSVVCLVCMNHQEELDLWWSLSLHWHHCLCSGLDLGFCCEEFDELKQNPNGSLCHAALTVLQ